IKMAATLAGTQLGRIIEYTRAGRALRDGRQADDRRIRRPIERIGKFMGAIVAPKQLLVAFLAKEQDGFVLRLVDRLPLRDDDKRRCEGRRLARLIADGMRGGADADEARIGIRRALCTKA